MKTHARAIRRKQRDRRSLAIATGVVGGLLLATGCYLWLLGAGNQFHGTIRASFNLVESDGQPVTERSFRGKFLLIYFGYTSCRDVCPTTLTSIAAALDRLGDRAQQVQPLFITVDPDRDTPEVIQRYVRSFTPRLIGLTGTAAELHRVARQYGIRSTVNPDLTLDHSSVIYLVGKDGQVIAPMQADEDATKLAHILGNYIS